MDYCISEDSSDALHLLLWDCAESISETINT